MSRVSRTRTSVRSHALGKPLVVERRHAEANHNEGGGQPLDAKAHRLRHAGSFQTVSGFWLGPGRRGQRANVELTRAFWEPREGVEPSTYA